MSKTVPAGSALAHSLVEVDDSILVVIDIQQCFLNKYDDAKVQSILGKVCWLLEVARHLGVPVVAMAEDIDNNGTLVDDIKKALPADTKIHNKDYFGLTGNPEILSAINSTGRKTAVCVGMETDVCVAQTAIGLLEEGYRVVVPRDGVATTEWDEQVGINRMRDAGVMLSSVKALYYEWMRSVSGCRRLDNIAPDLKVKRPTTLTM
jgi:nicotinamidase-related amidase